MLYAPTALFCSELGAGFKGKPVNHHFKMEIQLAQSIFVIFFCEVVAGQQRMRQELPFLCRQDHKGFFPTEASIWINTPTSLKEISKLLP